MEMPQITCSPSISFILCHQQPSLGSSYSNPRFQNFLMRGYKDFSQDDWKGKFGKENFVKTVAIILLWIIFFLVHTLLFFGVLGRSWRICTGDTILLRESSAVKDYENRRCRQ